MNIGTISNKRESMAPPPLSVVEGDPITSKLVAPRTSTSAADAKMKAQSLAEVNLMRKNISHKVPTTSSVLLSTPTSKAMAERKLPSELTGHPQIVGHEAQTEALFAYTRGIAQTIFASSAFDILFPPFLLPAECSRVSLISTGSRGSSVGTGSKIPIHRMSGMSTDNPSPSEEALSMEAAFVVLSNAVKGKHGKAAFMSDFYLLYLGLVVVIGADVAGFNALRFLDSFLQLGVVRSPEANVLFAILIRVFDRRGFRPLAVSATARLTQLEPALLHRLENGVSHRNAVLSTFCKDALTQMGKTAISKKQGRFRDISIHASEQSVVDSLGKFVELLADNGQPDDLRRFLDNIVRVMTRFNKSPMVLERGAACAESVLPFFPDVTVEILFELLSVCFDILSGETFLTGDNAFPAVEGLQRLTTLIAKTAIPETFLAAMVPLVAESSGVKLESVVEALAYFVRQSQIEDEILEPISRSFATFHSDLSFPPCLVVPSDSTDQILDFEHSIDRLCSTQTVLDELINIMEHNPEGDFSGYPAYLHPVLQIAWIAMIGTRPPNTDSETWDLVTRIREEVAQIPPDKLSESSYRPKALLEKLQDAIKE
jgi:hypothetical protein